MSCKPGSYAGGIRSIEDIRNRCRITEDDCWVYTGAPRPQPQFWMHELKKPASAGSAICYLLTGKLPQRNTVWRVVCTTKNCLNPEHRKPTKRGTLLGETNRKRDAVTKSRVAMRRRADSRLSDEDVAAIIADDRPQPEIAADWNISRGYVSLLKLERRRSHPIGPASSVFSWRPA